MAERVSEEEAARALSGLSGWSVSAGVVQKQFQFADFRGSIAFVNRVAELAESANHHPDITINYNRVSIALTTHDAGGITGNDLDLARAIEADAGRGR